jgi:hypothetical protein
VTGAERDALRQAVSAEKRERTMTTPQRQRLERNGRVARAQHDHPELFARIRSCCVLAGERFDLDDHAAGIVEIVARAKTRRVLA